MHLTWGILGGITRYNVQTHILTLWQESRRMRPVQQAIKKDCLSDENEKAARRPCRNGPLRSEKSYCKNGARRSIILTRVYEVNGGIVGKIILRIHLVIVFSKFGRGGSFDESHSSICRHGPPAPFPRHPVRVARCRSQQACTKSRTSRELGAGRYDVENQ